MNYANLIPNDIVDSDNGVCVSLWFGGCDLYCSGCQNKNLWSSENIEDNTEIANEIIQLIPANGVKRSFSVLGGEPLTPQNRKDAAEIIHKVRRKYPTVIIRLWTGRTMERVLEEKDEYIESIMRDVDFLITGPYIEAERTTSMPLIGSENQKIYHKNENGEFVTN